MDTRVWDDLGYLFRALTREQRWSLACHHTVLLSEHGRVISVSEIYRRYEALIRDEGNEQERGR